MVSADGSGADESLVDALRDAHPTFAAIAGIAPADAAAIAEALGLRHAVQSWEAPADGKAIFWRPDIPVVGLSRVDFTPQSGAAAPTVSGLLRLTFSWGGHSIHVLCARITEPNAEADWQLAQIARELIATGQEPVLFALAGDPGGRGAVLPGVADAWDTARWRSVAYPPRMDVGWAARAAFGVTQADPTLDIGRWLHGGPVRILCTDHFTVVRACHRPTPGLLARDGATIVDLDLTNAERPAGVSVGAP